MTPTVTLRAALEDQNLLGGVLAGDSWHAWRSLLLAAWGEPLEPTELETFTRLTGREKPPPGRVEEFLGVIGRRGGKSRAMAALAAYIAGLCDHSEALTPGERGVVLCIAPDQRQARISLDYAAAVFEATPMLSQLIANRTADTIELTTGIVIEVRAASFRRLRGPTYVAVLADEAAFWYSDEAGRNTDTEILAAVRPGLATTRGPLIIISSPYAKSGEVFQIFSRHYGPEGDPLVLVAKGTSRELNPTLPQSVIDRAMERDPESASAEFLAQFRGDIEAFITHEAISACVLPGIIERKPARMFRYYAFVDPSGGVNDAMTMAISHKEGDTPILDVLRERRPPFSPEATVQEFADICKRYRITKVSGDAYGGEWPREAFRRFGVNYEVVGRNKSAIFLDFLPLVNSRSCDLLDNDRMASQFVGLERRTTRGGRDSIDHRPGAHDDLANAAAGAITEAMKHKSRERSDDREVIVEGISHWSPHLGSYNSYN